MFFSFSTFDNKKSLVNRKEQTVSTKIKTMFFFSTLMEPPVNREDLPALTLEGPIKEHPVLDPLAVLHPDN